MKRALVFLLALGMVFSLCACGGETDMGEAVSPSIVNGEVLSARDFLIDDPEHREAPVQPTAEPAQEDAVPAGSGQYVVLTEYPELFTERVLDDAAVAALKDADPETLREEISTPADFAAWLDT